MIDRIELTPNQQGKLDIDLYGDLAGILNLAGKNDRPLDQSDPSVQQARWLRGLATTFTEHMQNGGPIRPSVDGVKIQGAPLARFLLSS
jgi:hypothetical protein